MITLLIMKRKMGILKQSCLQLKFQQKNLFPITNFSQSNNSFVFFKKKSFSQNKHRSRISPTPIRFQIGVRKLSLGYRREIKRSPNKQGCKSISQYLTKLKQKKALNQQRKREIRINQLSSKSKDKYQLIGNLGQGSYATVMLGYDTSKKIKVAIKKYNSKFQSIIAQISVLKGLHHPNIANLLDIITFDGKNLLVLQYAGANSLLGYILSREQKRLQQKEALNYFWTIFKTIDFLHNKMICHRDIKAQNILINRNRNLKIIDFGFSIILKEHQSTVSTFCGTPSYMSPQVILRKPYKPKPADYWSLGVLLFLMVQGNYPFRGRNQQDLFQQIQKGVFIIQRQISSNCKKLLEGLLNTNSQLRFSRQQIWSRRKWFQGRE